MGKQIYSVSVRGSSYFKTTEAIDDITAALNWARRFMSVDGVIKVKCVNEETGKVTFVKVAAHQRLTAWGPV